MRVPKAWIPLISKNIVSDLLKKGLLEAKVPVEKLVSAAEGIITDELMVEDRINEEVREILKKYSDEIEKGRLDYRTIFELTKKKVVSGKGVTL